jgi:glutamate synthase (NADPH) small chain
MYRRDRANMPGSQREVQNAEEEGIVFDWLSAPKAFVATKNFSRLEDVAKQDGSCQGVMGFKMRLGSPDATGRRVPEVIEGSEYVEDADLVVKALGFEPEDLPKLFDEPKLPVTRWGTVKVAFETGKTELDGVYAVGDIVRGASLVVWAIRDGRDTADAILKELNLSSAIAAE